MKILVLQHMACEGLGGMETLQEKGIEYEYIQLHMGAKLPRDTTRYAGTIILGGPMNVYQEKEYPFLRDENIFIKKCSQKKSPCSVSA